jgi:hypothetical protein
MPHPREAGEPGIRHCTLIYPCAVRAAIGVDELGVAAVALDIVLELEEDPFGARVIDIVARDVREIDQSVGELNIEGGPDGASVI